MKLGQRIGSFEGFFCFGGLNENCCFKVVVFVASCFVLLFHLGMYTGEAIGNEVLSLLFACSQPQVENEFWAGVLCC